MIFVGMSGIGENISQPKIQKYISGTKSIHKENNSRARSPDPENRRGAKMEMRVRNRTSQQQNERPPVRRGFTLLELLVAIVIISVLAAFLLPAIQGIVGTGKEAAVRAEISQLESAIATFKQKYGIEPPSSIRLYEAATGDPSWATDSANDASRVASRAIIQRIWPNFDFTLNRDINGDQVRNSVFQLYGPECLVFFLGGVNTYSPGVDLKPGVAGTDDDGNGVVDDDNEYFYSGSDDTVALTPSGFSKNPSNPFVVGAGQVSEGPFFEFVPSRLANSSATNFKVYRDPLGGQTTPYYYLSSYEGSGYKRFGLDGRPGVAGFDDDSDSKIDFDDAPTNTIPDVAEINWAGSDDEFPSATFVMYQQSSGGVAHKPKSFQIISPGIDGLYGVGGVFDISQSNSGLSSKDDYDNITNFASGKLKP